MHTRIDVDAVFHPRHGLAFHRIWNGRRRWSRPAVNSTARARAYRASNLLVLPILGFLASVGLTLGITPTLAASPNQPPTVRFVEPSQGSGMIAPASFNLSATGTDVDGTVVRLSFTLNGSALGIANSNSASLPVRLPILGNYQFTVTATDDHGATATASLSLVVKSAPTVNITFPNSNARLTEATNAISGTAADPRGISQVEYAVNSEGFQSAIGTDRWLAPANFAPGTNIIRARSFDHYGNSSLIKTRSFFRAVPTPIALSPSGSGTILPLTNGQALDLNRGYRISASPAPGFVFSNWTGSIVSTERDLHFLMEPNFNLTAHFVPNPFTDASGAYHGLFMETRAPRHESSGDFVLQVTPTGSYSAFLRLAGRSLRASGRFDLEGKATNVIARPDPGQPPVAVTWTLDLQRKDAVTGEVSEGSWQADLSGDRARIHPVTNPSSLVGRYTMAGEPTAEPGAPTGNSWAGLTLTPYGLVTAIGSLADGTKMTRSAPISNDGDWPFYTPLYRNVGSIIGWIQFDRNDPANRLQGETMWFRPRQSGSVFPEPAFTNAMLFAGSRYLPPTDPAARIVTLTNANVVVTGTGLSQSWTNPVIFGPRNVTNPSPSRLSLSVAPSTGLFKGMFTEPVSGITVPFSGVFIQNPGQGAGYFLSPTAHGRISIE